MKLIINFAIIFLLTKSTNAVESYPVWFLYPKNYKGITIGFSYGDSVPEVDAERMYCVYKECIASGYLDILKGSDLRDSEYFYYFSSDSLEKIKSNLYLIDFFVNNILTNNIVAAFSTDSTFQLEKKYVSLDTLNPPNWIDSTSWREDGFLYGVGMFTSIANDNDAWKTAEERAMFSLLNAVTIKIHKLELYLEQEGKNDFQQITRLKLNTKLSNIEVLERWADLRNKYFYVLIRIKLFDIIPLYKY